MRLRSLIVAAGIALVVLTGCGDNPSSAHDDTCAQVTTQKDELQQVAATIAALDLDIPHPHNRVKRSVQQQILDFCAEPGVGPDATPYDNVVKRLRAQQ